MYRTKRDGELKKYVILMDERNGYTLKKSDTEPIKYRMKKLNGGKYRLVTHPRFY